MKPDETIADIIAEKRRRAEEIERDCAEKMKRGEMISDRYARELVADIRQEADRLEAAYKREAVTGSNQFGNAAKLREVCEKMLDLLTAEGFEDGGMSIELDEKQVIMWRNRFRAALAEPLRNCDVGTAEEQSVRMAEFCRAQCKKTDGVRLCSGCRFFELAGTECPFAWAQLPYEEGCAK